MAWAVRGRHDDMPPGVTAHTPGRPRERPRAQGAPIWSLVYGSPRWFSMSVTAAVRALTRLCFDTLHMMSFKSHNRTEAVTCAGHM